MDAVQKDDKQIRSVFIGNIPYESTEAEIQEILSQIGSIVSFKMMYDRDSGKPKGYGFCEYPDIETAQAAIRNLNGMEFKSRILRVDSATVDNKSSGAAKNANESLPEPPQHHAGLEHHHGYGQSASSALFMHPSVMPAHMGAADPAISISVPITGVVPSSTNIIQGVLPTTHVTGSLNVDYHEHHPKTMEQSPYGEECLPENTVDKINQKLAEMTPEEIFQFLVQMKACAEMSIDETREMLIQNPQLCYSVLHALLIMNVVDQKTFEEIVSAASENVSQSQNQNQVHFLDQMKPAVSVPQVPMMVPVSQMNPLNQMNHQMNPLNHQMAPAPPMMPHFIQPEQGYAYPQMNNRKRRRSMSSSESTYTESGSEERPSKSRRDRDRDRDPRRNNSYKNSQKNPHSNATNRDPRLRRG